jgi:pimeloyl-ACP methyl ester carboxylesterase
MTPLVLVHGGGFDRRCWDRLIPHLKPPVVAVDLPGRGTRPAPLESLTFADCARAIVDDVEAAGFDQVVLVVHSLGGCSAAPTLELLGERVRHIVFVAAMVPAHGHGTHQEWSSDLRQSIDEDRQREKRTMSPERVKVLFGNDMDDGQLAWCIERLVPEAESLTTDPVDLRPLEAPTPRTWILTTQDAILVPDMQRRFIGNVDGACRVIEIDAGHMCMISQPEALAKILNDLDTEAGTE